ncbi:hypothetical protein F6X40_40475 [Paraburkholderia sp. UCT31]|uniref:hypothetical protein n=1 Tax=Paraburkholderia sp. UCT31 TaxID=2615209 RepID=UPI001654DD79|nr:hypothetical protein [Paraburkholderia sp. UCT31]MBC8742758.1 hypothetical protein [Paraburkholderia sp. UCT31]
MIGLLFAAADLGKLAGELLVDEVAERIGEGLVAGAVKGAARSLSGLGAAILGGRDRPSGEPALDKSGGIKDIVPGEVEPRE